VISTMFERRTYQDVAADSFGSLLTKIGLGGLAIGLVVKLLFTTQDEIDAGVPTAGFRIGILWFFGFTLLATLLLGRTKFGSWIFAVGGNKQASRQVGVPAARTKTQLFMIVAVAAWLVGLLLAFRLDTVQSVAGNGLEFEYIIAAVVGGTLLTGGYGSAFGASIGALIVVMAKLGIPSARWNSDWRFAFLGLILLAAVIANNFIKTKAEASR
jgi:simple sugar transport system permease protein